MTIPEHFAIFPKTCDKCRRRFLLEQYGTYYRLMGIEQIPVKFIRCKKCKEERE